MNLHEMTIAALKVERQRIDTAIAALELLGSWLTSTLAPGDQAMPSAADTREREASSEATAETRPRRGSPKKAPADTTSMTPLVAQRFAPLRRRLIASPATRSELLAVSVNGEGWTKEQRAKNFENALYQARAAGLVGRTGQTWSITDAWREWQS